MLFSKTYAGTADRVRDEVLSEKYEGLMLDGEDEEVIEDMMTQEGVTKEDLELSEEE